ncbi:unnamed protein product, partial [Allacma fusca]
MKEMQEVMKTVQEIARKAAETNKTKRDVSLHLAPTRFTRETNQSGRFIGKIFSGIFGPPEGITEEEKQKLKESAALREETIKRVGGFIATGAQKAYETMSQFANDAKVWYDEQLEQSAKYRKAYDEEMKGPLGDRYRKASEQMQDALKIMQENARKEAEEANTKQE